MPSRRAVCAGLVAAPWIRPAKASDAWPDRPVRILVPFAAGGAADTLARLLGEHFREVANGQPLIVENRVGAAGTLAAAVAATAAPDGYTLLLGDIGANAVADSIYAKLPYHYDRSFRHIIHLVNLPLVLIGNAGAGNGTLEGFIETARARPGALNYASAGLGNASHLAMEMLLRMAKVTVTHVPYRGGAPAVVAVLTKEVELSFPSILSARPFIEAGNVQALGVGSEKPSHVLPDVRPIAHMFAGFSADTWHGIHVPAAMPDALATRIHSVFATLLNRPDMRDKITGLSGLVAGGSPEDYARFVRSEAARWGELVKSLGLRQPG